MKIPLFCLIIILSLFSTNVSSQPLEPPLEVLNKELLDASYDGSVEEVQRLLLMGADIYTTNRYGSTPFKLGVDGNNCSVVELFLRLGQDPNRESNKGTPEGTPLMSASANGNAEMVQLLLKYGAGPDYPASGGHTALMSATGHTEIFRLLIDHKADIHARDNYGRTVLIWAALHGTEEVVSLLCNLGVDPEAKDKAGNTALTEGKNSGRLSIVKLLRCCSRSRARN